jgi:hypothetical protein
MPRAPQRGCAQRDLSRGPAPAACPCILLFAASDLRDAERAVVQLRPTPSPSNSVQLNARRTLRAPAGRDSTRMGRRALCPQRPSTPFLASSVTLEPPRPSPDAERPHSAASGECGCAAPTQCGAGRARGSARSSGSRCWPAEEAGANVSPTVTCGPSRRLPRQRSLPWRVEREAPTQTPEAAAWARAARRRALPPPPAPLVSAAARRSAWRESSRRRPR